MKASVLSFRAAVLFVIACMIWGIAMGISQDHSTMPAHAHLNLLGWVSLFLFGFYYHLHPSLNMNRLAKAQVWIWIAATVVLTLTLGIGASEALYRRLSQLTLHTQRETEQDLLACVTEPNRFAALVDTEVQSMVFDARVFLPPMLLESWGPSASIGRSEHVTTGVAMLAGINVMRGGKQAVLLQGRQVLHVGDPLGLGQPCQVGTVQGYLLRHPPWDQRRQGVLRDIGLQGVLRGKVPPRPRLPHEGLLDHPAVFVVQSTPRRAEQRRLGGHNRCLNRF